MMVHRNVHGAERRIMRRSGPTSAGILLFLLGVGYLSDFSGAVGGGHLLHAPRSHAPPHSTAHLLRVASLRGGDQPSLVGKRLVSEESAPAVTNSEGAQLLSAQAPSKRIALRGGKAAEEPGISNTGGSGTVRHVRWGAIPVFFLLSAGTGTFGFAMPAS